VLPAHEFIHAILGQAEQVEHNADREGHGEILDEFHMAFLLELADELFGAAADLAFKLRHAARGKDRFQGAAEGGVLGGIELGGDHVPAFADHGGKLGIALLDEVLVVLVNPLHVFGAAQYPAAARGNGEDIGGVDNVRALVQLGDDNLVRVFVGNLAGCEGKFHRQLWWHVGWQWIICCAHGGEPL